MDELIERIRARAADPSRRTEVRPTVFAETVRGLDPAGLLAGLRLVRTDLDASIAASRAGRVDPASRSRADAVAASMTTPAARDLPAPADVAAVERAEAALGVSLPVLLRRVYLEVADGGVGPGMGLAPLATVVERYGQLRSGEELPRRASWPLGLLPVVDRDPGWDCVEAASGRVVGWDPEGLSERSTAGRFERSFVELAPSVESWLTAWLEARTFEERMAEQVAAANLRAAREARARIGAKTPEERARMGLPEVGWERVVWGGLGLEEDSSD